MIDIPELKIEIEDIPSEHMQMVAYQCGVPVSISLMQNIPGLELYIPVSCKKAIERNYIREKFDGNNSASISVHLGISHDKVKKFIRKNYSNKSEEPVYTTEHMAIVASRCGEEVAQKLVVSFPNTKLYIPKNGFSVSIRRYIERNCNGFNVANLAIRCGVTERYIRKIMSDIKNSTSQCTLDLGI